MFQEPQKEQPSASGVAASEAEGEFVEIGIQVRCGDRALMGAEQPALEQGGHAMHRRHGNVGRIRAAMLVAVLAGESPAGGNCSVATVVISGSGASDHAAGSPEVKVSVGRGKTFGQLRRGGEQVGRM